MHTMNNVVFALHNVAAQTPFFESNRMLGLAIGLLCWHDRKARHPRTLR